MSLDERVLKIVTDNVRYVLKNNKYPEEIDVTVDLQMDDRAIAQIKQAFEDEYPDFFKQYGVSAESGLPFKPSSMWTVGDNFMTGEEWYEKFEKEMKGKLFPFKRGGGEDVHQAVNFCKEAAKRAAGLGE